MTKSLVTVLAFLAITVVSVHEAHAAPIINDTFESYAVGSSAAMSPPWTVVSGPATQFVAQSPFEVTPTDDRGVELENAVNVSPAVFRSFAGNVGPLYLQYDFNSINQDGNSGLQVSGAGGLAVNLHMINFNNSNPSYVDGTTTPNPTRVNLPVSLSNSTWYRNTLTMRSGVDTFDIRIQTIQNTSIDQTFTGLNFQNPVTNFNQIRFHFNTIASNGGGEFYIDNVLLTDNPNDLRPIPEPASLLMVISVLTMLAMKRGNRHSCASPMLLQ